MTDPLPGAVPLADPGPPPPAPSGMPPASDRFFAWVRGLGVVRADGWLGGVCGGIAARLRIDPAIVRGIVVVAAVLGLPMFLLYAIAWALLPDLDGRIHLQQLFRKQWDPALTGILILVVLTVVPVLPWFWSLLFWPLWGAVSGGGYPAGGIQYGWELLPSWLTVLLGWGLTIVVVGGLVFLAARAARRTRTPRADSDPRTASADHAAPGAAEAPSSGVGASAAFSGGDVAEHTPDAAASDSETVPLAPPTAPLEPPRPAGPATDADIAAWRAQHEAWRAQNDAWRRQQQDAGRAAREQARREREATGALFAAEAAERRRVRRLTAPRTSAAVVGFVLGAALVAGAATALWWSGDGEYAVALGIFLALLVVGVGMIVAGALRRRTGFLAFVAIMLVLGGVTATTATTLRGVHVGSYSFNSYSSIERPFVQLWGSIDVALLDIRKTRDPIVLQQRDGYTSITVSPGVELSLTARSGSGQVQLVTFDRDTGEYIDQGLIEPRVSVDDGWLVEATITSEGAPVTTTQSVEIDQRSGTITVFVTEP